MPEEKNPEVSAELPEVREISFIGRLDSVYLRERLQLLEESYRATLNMLEDYEEERSKLEFVQMATINLLDDFNEDREKIRLTQKATMNLLEDMNEEREKLDVTRRALTNILEDVEIERNKTVEAKALLESVNKELEAFSYSVSHDLRAPLRAINGFSEALMEDCEPELDANGKRFLLLIQENAQRMGKLVDDLLSFSRLGRQELEKKEIDMEVLADTVFKELRNQEPERDVELTIYAMPRVLGDYAMLQQVFANLFSNAIKFTKTREKAHIEFGYKEIFDSDSCPISSQNIQGAYYIRDNGVGFDMKYADKLFGVFQRLHSIAEFEGTGIGLALVYRIISRHGGWVWAEGKVDEGATLHFTFPKADFIKSLS